MSNGRTAGVTELAGDFGVLLRVQAVLAGWQDMIDSGLSHTFFHHNPVAPLAGKTART
jgi:hypothetical protein